MGRTGIISDDDCYLFGKGTHYEIYEKLGAHQMEFEGRKGFYFAVWAPHATAVSVTGDFCGWSDGIAMERINEDGIYEVFTTEVPAGSLYKYVITSAAGQKIFKADPYASSAELRPGTASRACPASSYRWKDGKWLARRRESDPTGSAMSIYEVHLGSWKKNGEEFYSYRELAPLLAAYVKDMGYTHIEILGLLEHPFDGSWGYQVTGYYAPTSRYGTPDDFRYFVDYMHRKGIGLILDWVPAHFPRDAHGLAMFDGEPLYEYADPKKGEHKDWGTMVFDYSRTEVSNFLIASALYWVEKFHIDGLRVDAVASMLYLDYSREDGQWTPNQYGGNQNLEAIEFFRHLNSIMKYRNPGSMMIAEESTAWPGVTQAQQYGGLGFTFKWNMGWMHDFLEYMKLDPFFRKDNHNKMTFSMTYACSENFILVLSHDEVVHLKCSMLNKMPGYMADKFANLKAAYTFMMGHPGKKLLFMGQEFGQLREWSEERELDWDLLDSPEHSDLQKYYSDLLHMYKKYPAFYGWDYNWDGFEWINCDDAYRSIFSFVRKSPTGRNNMLIICNFTPVAHADYRVGVPKKGKYTLILDNEHGLLSADAQTAVTAERSPCDGRDYSIAHPLSAYGTAVFKFR